MSYRVAYSQRVRDELRELVQKAEALGLAPQVLAAAKVIDERLHVYPQFGQPLRDLILEPAKLWIGEARRLVVQYTLDEEKRIVMVPVPFRPIPFVLRP